MLTITGSLTTQDNANAIPEIVMVMTLALIEKKKEADSVYFKSIHFLNIEESEDGYVSSFESTVAVNLSGDHPFVGDIKITGRVYLNDLHDNPADTSCVAFEKRCIVGNI